MVFLKLYGSFENHRFFNLSQKKSPLKNNPKIKVGKVNILNNIKKLQHRCQECNKLINN